jgi:hypothetical protein
MREVPVTTDLPAALFREIGRVIVAYAKLEHRLSAMLYVLLGVDPKRGRLAVREPRATDRVEVIRDLIQVGKIDVATDMKLLADAVDQAQRERDQLAHGIWLHDPVTKATWLRLTKGSWQPIKGQRGKTKRVVMPQSIRFDVPECRELRKLISETATMITLLGNEVDSALAASRKKPSAQHQPARRHRDRSRATSQPQP